MNNVNVEAINNSKNAIEKNPEMGFKQWKTSIKWLDGLACQLNTKNFQTTNADVGQALGGTNSAPTPIEYLLNAAGSCFTITFQMLASQESIKIYDFSLEIEADFSAIPFLGIKDDYAGVYNMIFKVDVHANASDKSINEIANLAISRSPVVDSLKFQPNLIINQV